MGLVRLSFFCLGKVLFGPFSFKKKDRDSNHSYPLLPEAAQNPQELLHIQAARVFGWLFVGRRRRPGGRRQGHPQPAGELLPQRRREQGPHAAHILLHPQPAPLLADLLGQHQGAGQRVGRRGGRPRRAVRPRPVLISESVHGPILCSRFLACSRHTRAPFPIGCTKGVIPTTPEEMERFLKDRQNSTEEALMAELTRMTREQEQAGEMSPTRMEEIYSTLSPFLSELQREKMREVIRRLKG